MGVAFFVREFGTKEKAQAHFDQHAKTYPQIKTKLDLVLIGDKAVDISATEIRNALKGTGERKSFWKLPYKAFRYIKDHPLYAMFLKEEITVKSAPVDGKNVMTYTIADRGRQIELALEDGKVVSCTVDGQAVQVLLTGKRLVVAGLEVQFDDKGIITALEHQKPIKQVVSSPNQLAVIGDISSFLWVAKLVGQSINMATLQLA
jgi:hypothetical protein